MTRRGRGSDGGRTQGITGEDLGVTRADMGMMVKEDREDKWRCIGDVLVGMKG